LFNVLIYIYYCIFLYFDIFFLTNSYLGDDAKNGDIDGELGDPGFGDQDGDIPEASDWADGEKLGPPGVMPLGGPDGDHSP
jgi:hypothetical protein